MAAEGNQVPDAISMIIPSGKSIGTRKFRTAVTDRLIDSQPACQICFMTQFWRGLRVQSTGHFAREALREGGVDGHGSVDRGNGDSQKVDATVAKGAGMSKRMSSRLAIVTLSLMGSIWSDAATRCAEAEGKENGAPTFLRVRRDDRDLPVSLETAVTRYVPAGVRGDSDRSIDLVGAVHIGESTYYAELNRLFGSYDAVLYELVAAADANVPEPGQRSGHPVGLLQVAMKNLLELEFQLDRINYRQPNFVHADLTPEEFQRSMSDRSESFSKMFFRLMGQGLAQQSKDPARNSDFAVLSAFLSPDRAVELKRAMAVQFEDLEMATLAFDGPQGSTIITERNKRALQVLQNQVSAGKKRLAIFYGAAHLPDFDRKLREQFNYVPTDTRWMAAWNLQSARQREATSRKP
jgi:hypothetical protein